VKYNIFVVILVLFLSSCASSPQDTQHLSVLQNERKVEGNASFSHIFEAINGEKLKVGAFTTPNKASHIIEPGVIQAQLKVTYTDDKFNGVMVSDFVIALSLEAGETYKIKSQLIERCISINVINSIGENVAGPFTKQFLGFESPKRIYYMITKNNIDEVSEKCLISQS
jgi:hypothetical protein